MFLNGGILIAAVFCYGIPALFLPFDIIKTTR